MKHRNAMVGLVLTLGLAGWAGAQAPAGPAPQADGPPQRGPLRSALRDARHEPPAAAGDPRRLSEQERAQLRQQLREGARPAPGARP